MRLCWDVFLLTPEKGSWPLPFLPLQWLVAMETDAQGSRIAGLKLLAPLKKTSEAGKWINYEPSLCLRTIASVAGKPWPVSRSLIPVSLPEFKGRNIQSM